MSICKSMVRERSEWHWLGERKLPEVQCEKCGGVVREGDWPFCKGQPEDHVRE